jgi:hypothetical protein
MVVFFVANYDRDDQIAAISNRKRLVEAREDTKRKQTKIS